jgi:DNA-binding Lrp family transcriptional regulator
VISGYRAVLNPAALGIGVIAYVTVGLSQHTKASQSAFEAAMQPVPEVRECHNITGTVEYLLRVEAADLAAYKLFHTETLGALPMVANIVTFIVMGSPKDERG